MQEQADQAREAREAVAQREHEIDVDYGAWSLLRDTLKEADSEDAVHLGNALVEPVSERMSALTGGRYGPLALEPDLQTRGIEVGGARRDYETLSVGTQEQLATLLRISIAEALDSFLVLDDQLTQSDPERIDWLRGLLRSAADQIQLVVFTCRPDDYLTSEDAAVHAVDLTGVVKRNFVGVEQAQAEPEPPPKRERKRAARGKARKTSEVPDLTAALKDSLKDKD